MTPPERVPWRGISPTTPLSVVPGSASKVTLALWPAATRLIVVSSMAATTCNSLRFASVRILVVAAILSPTLA